MARYRENIDLGQLINAQFIFLPKTDKEGNIVYRKDAQGNVIKDKNGNSVPQTISGIFIPNIINGIDVKQADKSKVRSGFRAFINIRQAVSQSFGKYCESIKTRLMQHGETITAYNVPAYNVIYSLSEEKRTKIRQWVKMMVLQEHPEWQGQEDVKGTDLATAISTIIPFNIGDSYLLEEREQDSNQNQTTAVAQGVSGYTPIQDDPFAAGANAYEDPNSDLPF